MSEDLETQPLLEPHRDINEVAIHALPVNRQRWRLRGKLFAISSAALVLVAIVVFMVRFIQQLPSQEAIEDSIIAVSNWKVNKIHLDGWTNGDGLNNDSGKALQISTQIDFWLDYDGWIADNATSLSREDKKRYRFFSEKLVRTVCLNLNNVTTFDGDNTKDNIVGFLSIKEPFCVDLHNNSSTILNLTMLLDPNMDNVMRILKKIWKHDYDGINLSSIVDVTLMKQANFFSHKGNFPLAKFQNISISWRDIIDWGSITSAVRNLRHLLEQLIVRKLSLTDSIRGFHMELEAEPVAVNDLIHLIELPHNAAVPAINWELKLPDCNNKYTINLATVHCFTDAFEISERINFSAHSDVEGPLPNALLTNVCWSDEENAVTPMTKLLNKVFNGSELITMEVKGHPRKSDFHSGNSILPFDILERALREISFFPISANFTLNSNSLIQDVTVDGLKIKWVTSFLGEKRLSVMGKVVALITLPFYETNKDRLLIDHIKGESLLYHDGRNFLTIPMRYWTKASSRILHNEETNTTMVEVSFSIKDDEVQVTNSMELTRVLNEILMKGKAIVDLESNLDVLLSSPLGEMALMGLKGTGQALVRS